MKRVFLSTFFRHPARGLRLCRKGGSSLSTVVASGGGCLLLLSKVNVNQAAIELGTETLAG